MSHEPATDNADFATTKEHELFHSAVESPLLSPSEYAVPDTQIPSDKERDLAVKTGKPAVPENPANNRYIATDGGPAEKRPAQPDHNDSTRPRTASDMLGPGISSSKNITRVGPYILGKTLGVGSTGRVKLGTHMDSNRKVAIKILSKSLFKSGDLQSKKVEREIAVMKLVLHPHVMALYDVYESNEELFMILELVEGGELFDFLVKKGKLGEPEALNFFQQIIMGIDFCHQHLVFHRDLKPENLLLDAKMNIKIADFGMASLQPTGKLLETSCGSPHYASPEIIRGDRYHGGPADIWSCGVILYALLTGNLPFDDENIRRLLTKVKNGRFYMPNHLSEPAKDLITQMMNVDPVTRISMDGIISHPWFKSNNVKIERPMPVYRQLKNQSPIESTDDIDEEIVTSLKMLGWTDEIQLVTALQQPEDCLEKVFYYLLFQRKMDYLENSEMTVSLWDLSSGPKRRAQSSSSLYSSRMSLRSASVKGDSNEKLNDGSVSPSSQRDSFVEEGAAENAKAHSNDAPSMKAPTEAMFKKATSASAAVPPPSIKSRKSVVEVTKSHSRNVSGVRIASPLSKSMEALEIETDLNRKEDQIAAAAKNSNAASIVSSSLFASESQRNSSSKIASPALSDIVDLKEPQPKRPLSISIPAQSFSESSMTAGTPKFHRRRVDIALPSPILASVSAPKKSWFSSIFTFVKPETISFQVRNSDQSANDVLFRLRQCFEDMHVRFQERKELGLKCLVEYVDGKTIKFKVDVIGPDPDFEQSNTTLRINIILQQGQVPIFKDFCQQFSDICCSQQNWLELIQE